MQKIILLLGYLIIFNVTQAQYTASIKEYNREFKTYPFSDPDPIPKFELIYPYFRFDGYTDKPIIKEWKVVELENEYIKVMILPEIGGKIWTAIEKSTGKPFIYFNQVVKFRDIAMRGAWTSGGIEANYGIIGHTPNCSTPVDYWKETKLDGSVSCYIGTLDLLTQTYWTMEINLPKDKAYFTTRSFWHNGTSVEQPYYTWMNAGIKAEGNLQFIYPGNKYIGHNGEYANWPINEKNGRDISYYKNNNFGQYKSYHVFGQYTDFFGGYWHNEDFGMGRYAEHAEKPGKKIWIWGLSQQGMIWEKLLTDTDGQYVEVQSGRLYNQTAELSTFTPFKHRAFAPYATDEWTEYWFPVKGIKGFVEANPYGSLNASIKDGKMMLAFSPLQDFSEEVKIMRGQKTLYSKKIEFKVLQPYEDAIDLKGETKHVVVMIGDKVMYEFDPQITALSRPVDSPKDFDWHSAYGLWIQGKEYVRSRNYKEAEIKLKESLDIDPNFLPALTDIAQLMNIRGLHQKAFDFALRALRIDTYDPEANYQYGLANAQLGNWVDAKDGFDIALQSVANKGAAAIELGKIYFKEKKYEKALHYVAMSIEQNKSNMSALELQAIIYRVGKNQEKALEVLATISLLNPLNHFQRFETYLWDKSEANKNVFLSSIQNEMPWETYLQLGVTYYGLGLSDESLEVLGLAPAHPEINYWMAFIKSQQNNQSFMDDITKANALSAEFVFPFRAESKKMMEWVTTQTNHWKPKYYLGLINWHANQLEVAKEMLTACGDLPDYAPFYAARAQLIKSTKEADLKHAAKIDKNQWRYGKLLVNHFIETNQIDKALVVAQDYHERFKENYILSMVLAKVLLKSGQYAASAKLLDNTTILPYEGATDGRILYNSVWLIQAVERMEQKDYKKALSFIQKASEWPEHLGVGKPYDADIDVRIEDYLQALCYSSMRKSVLTEEGMDKVLAFQQTFGVNDLITAFAYRKRGQQEKGESILIGWKNSFPDNKNANWSYETFTNGKSELAAIKEILLQKNY